MKSPSRPSPSRAALLLAALAANSCPALTPTEWQHRQALSVAAPGLVRVDLPAASFDSGGPQQEDFRVVDATGREIAILIDRPPVPVARVTRPASFEVKVAPGST